MDLGIEVRIINRVVRAGLTQATFAQDKGDKGTSHAGIWGKSQGKARRRNMLAFMKNSEEASVATAKRAKRSVLADEFREVLGVPLVQSFEGQEEL